MDSSQGSGKGGRTYYYIVLVLGKDCCLVIFAVFNFFINSGESHAVFLLEGDTL